MSNKEPRRLTCCCCGDDAGHWQQWWNRDTGFGLCVTCARRIGKKETPEEMNELYGIEGVHREPADPRLALLLAAMRTALLAIRSNPAGAEAVLINALAETTGQIN